MHPAIIRRKQSAFDVLHLRISLPGYTLSSITLKVADDYKSNNQVVVEPAYTHMKKHESRLGKHVTTGKAFGWDAEALASARSVGLMGDSCVLAHVPCSQLLRCLCVARHVAGVAAGWRQARLDPKRGRRAHEATSSLVAWLHQ